MQEVTGNPQGKHLHVSPLSHYYAFYANAMLFSFLKIISFEEVIAELSGNNFFLLPTQSIRAVTVIDIGERALIINIYEGVRFINSN